ncbi:MAG: HD domain-containing phosphohydrolase [Planctomycetota bacterium]
MDDVPRILVADDEVKICSLLKKLLEREGYDVTTVNDGGSALKEMLRRKPDLLISDIQMPGMDGLELSRRARSLDSDLPVVLITGYASMETAVQALREGVSDYITKPFSIAELKGVVGRILENRALAAENRRLMVELKVANQQLTQHRRRLTVRLKGAEDGLDSANRELKQRLGEMEVIHEISQMIATVFDETELLTLATQLIRDKVGVSAAAALMLEGAGTEFTGRGVRGLAGGLTDGDRIPHSDGIAGHALLDRRPVLVPDASRDPRLSPEELATFGSGSLLAVPVVSKESVLGVLMVSRETTREALGDAERDLLGLIGMDLAVALDNVRLFKENEQTYIEILAMLVESMEARDLYLRRHSERVMMKARVVAKALNLSPFEQEILETGARLHDIGKVGIPDDILKKPGRLTDEEMDEMRSHPVIGDRIVQPHGKLKLAKPIIRHHHEHWDGGGYPDGLAGEEIPLHAQIVTIVDAFDALTSDRSYRGAMSREKALSIIENDKGTHFGPLPTEVFLEIERERIVRHGKAEPVEDEVT